jgi:hypothetical protein
VTAIGEKSDRHTLTGSEIIARNIAYKRQVQLLDWEFTEIDEKNLTVLSDCLYEHHSYNESS